ncbi:molybdopterin molybdotransferase MoeA [Streptomyces sp. NBC_01476]|uniref:molybdopterin molybdotransferase MoeA n=1 Tax=Streptomyces sp. NBC_01476 TaxID=2903881 RepID=UPI002E37FFA1|nr:molybdopterin molybdotransferase MoeA [Streptomyces sp. NBC_01476]
MTAPGGDAADRALDDALALANDRRAATDRRPRAANDPLSVALGLSDTPQAAPARPTPTSPPARPAPPPPPTAPPSTSARPTPPAHPPAPLDALSVALRHGCDEPAEAPPRTREPREGGARGPAPAPYAPPAPHSPPHPPHPRDTPWPDARRIARQAGRRLAPRTTPLGDEALGSALARGLVALTDLPSFDSSAMDGWAVAGAGPWRLKGRLLAGQGTPEPLLDGHAARIATGAVLPPGAVAVLRSEHGRTERRTDGEWLRVLEPRFAPRPGQEVRRRGQECRSGDELLPAGTVVTPAVLGLAAASGYDELTVTARPKVEMLVLGDELLDHGLPRKGRVRDALGPMLPSWLRALGAEVTTVRRLVDDAEALREAVTASTADLIVTTGGTAGGPVDHVHPVLAAIGAKLLVDGVSVRPGHPMVLAELPAAAPGGTRAAGAVGPFLIGLPGNPLAAVSGVLTLVAPLLRTLGGRPVPAPYAAPLTADVPGHPVDTRLVPVVFDDESAARPLHFAGPAMLRGLAAADGMAVIPPGGARAGQETAVLDTGLLGPAWGSGG